MAYVVARPDELWEIRESRSTPAGPRGRTLATFRTLTPEVMERARSRSSGTLTSAELRRMAARAGAPIASRGVEGAGGELLAELAAGGRPRPVLGRLIHDALEQGRPRTSDSARAAGRWIGATPKQRGETLWDLLLLTDSLPPSRTPPARRFPRLRSEPA